MDKQQQTNDAFYFAKALFYTKLARDYFEYLIVETKATGYAKQTLKQYVSRFDYVYKDVIVRIGSEGFKQALKDDIENAPAIDSIANMYVVMKDEDRSKLEEFAENILKSYKTKEHE